MAAQTASRRPTLADVLDVVAHADIDERRRGEIRSALRTIARALNRPPDQIPADANALRRRLDEVSPIAVGLSAGRWANIRSHLRSALHLANGQLPRAKRQPMSSPWVELFQRLSKAGQIRLSRLLRYLSELDIGPASVTDEHLEQFREALQNDPLIKTPDRTWRLAMGVWNSSARQIPDWPALELHLKPRRETYSLPWTAFPSTFKADTEAFLTRMSGADLLDEKSCRPVRASTLDTRRRQLLTSASALVHRGRDPSCIQSLADVVEFGSFKEVLRFFTARRGNTSSTMIEHLARFLKSVARHWVNADATVLDKMAAVIKNLTVAHTGMTPKNRQRLSVFNDEENIYALLDLPQRLMRDARSGRYSNIRSAILAQVAVAIELLLVRPLRIGNLTGLELYRHLIRTRTGSWYVAISEDEVKNEFYLEHEVPAESIRLLERYLSDFRPLLAKPGNAALFPGHNGLGAKSKNTLAGQIKEKIQQYIGLTVNSHLFRHFAGFAHLRSNPGEYAVVAHVLGHKSLNTTKKYYTGMETAAAFRHFDKTIMDLRNRIRPSKGSLIRRSRASLRNKPSNGKG